MSEKEKASDLKEKRSSTVLISEKDQGTKTEEQISKKEAVLIKEKMIAEILVRIFL